MATTKEKFKAYLATGRVSNLPTIWCQAYTALLFVSAVYENTPLNNHTWTAFVITLCFLCLAGSMFYVGGCGLGDFYDIKYDKKHKPLRPLPSGVISPQRVALISWVLLVSAWLAIPLFSYFSLTRIITEASNSPNLLDQTIIPATLLFLSIFFYSKLHKKHPRISLGLMGLSRALLVTVVMSLAVSANIHAHIEEIYGENTPLKYKALLYPLSLFIYTIAFAKIAQTEHNTTPIKRVWVIPLFLASIFSFSNPFSGNPTNTGILLFFFILFVLWQIVALRHIPKNKGAFVGKAIAGFCLIDACFASTLDFKYAIPCFIFFGLTLLAQRYSPAT